MAFAVLQPTMMTSLNRIVNESVTTFPLVQISVVLLTKGKYYFKKKTVGFRQTESLSCSSSDCMQIRPGYNIVTFSLL